MQPEARPRSHREHELGLHPLAELAERQYGVVSIGQMRGLLGYSREGVKHAVRRGHVHRLHRGVYAVGHTDISLRGACLAAVFASGPDALLSFHSAAWLWGIARWSPIPVSVTAPVPRRSRGPIRVHRSRILSEADRDLVEGIPVTAIPRTALDLATTLRRRQLLRMLERAEELRLFDLDRFEELLDRAGGHQGVRPLRRALAIYRPAPFTRSGLERRFFDLVAEAGLPPPARNYVEAGYELDIYWPNYRFGVELDTFETHGSRQAFEDDRFRDESLKLAGIEMLRITGHRVDSEPRQVIERVARLFRRRRQSPSGSP